MNYLYSACSKPDWRKNIALLLLEFGWTLTTRKATVLVCHDFKLHAKYLIGCLKTTNYEPNAWLIIKLRWTTCAKTVGACNDAKLKRCTNGLVRPTLNWVDVSENTLKFHSTLDGASATIWNHWMTMWNPQWRYTIINWTALGDDKKITTTQSALTIN